MLKLSILATAAVLLFSKNTSAGEKSLYDFLWLDPDKKVYVLQNKIHKKEHTFYADVGYLSNFTSKFQETNGFQGKLGYYVHEEWGLELFYNQYSNRNNDEFRNIRVVNEQEPFIRRLNSSYGLNVIWSPFYGKINTFNKIFYFDWNFGAGIAQVNTESNIDSVVDGQKKTSFKDKSYTGAVLKTNFKLHLNEDIYVGVEYMNTYYRAPGPRAPKSDKLKTNTDLIFSIGYSF